MNGKSFLVARTIDTGMGEPVVSRANTNNVSVGDALPTKSGAIATVPLIYASSGRPAGLPGAEGSANAGIAF